jgi:hypothetical protein
MNKPHASDARSVIDQFHRALNAPGLLPDHALRRNAIHYALVSYVNNITGLFLSENYAEIPLFVARAFEHMSQRPPEHAYLPYFALVESYLKQLVYFLRTFHNVSFEEHDRIPPNALASGPQPAPIT